jgi:filamentous hemagglutinin
MREKRNIVSKEKVYMSKAKSGWFKSNKKDGERLIKEAKNNGRKITANDVVGIMKTNSGNIIWLEKGSDNGGLKHIIDAHGDQFEKVGIPKEGISSFVLNAVAFGEIIGYQGKGITRPIYHYVYGGKNYYVAVTVGENGFIVGSNIRNGGKKDEKD